ncbi:unnamed protein product [Phytophthora fragariaefolia]|uniref:Unnamed protein product n=1 Tax=Phytophthora fragariaefolia TaxID=1490495 RepID=A0A9W6WUW3_9STRA|nr:unnamed protein product [Phytophthora fragariaefolia]
MTTRTRSRPIEETTDPEEAGARKKQVVASSTTGTTKRQRMMQGRAQADDDQLAIEGEQAMDATEDVPKTYQQATASADHDEWKKAMKSELNSLVANKTWKLARLVANGYSQRQGVDYEETYSPVAYLNSIRAMLAKCGADGMEIEQCDVDTAFLYGKLEEEIYMELPEGLRELLELAEAKGEDDVVCMLLQRLCVLKLASRVWNETIDKHLKSMGFKPADADPCVYTRGEGEEECIVCLYVDDMLIASRQKTVIASVKAGIAEKFRVKDLGKARFILGIEIDYDMERITLVISQEAYTESTIKKFGQENAKPCLTLLEPGVHLTRADEPQTEDDKVKMKAKPYRSLVGRLIDCVKECIWMRRLLKNMGVDKVGATVIFEDNQGAMALAKNISYQARTKHIDIRYHFIREKVASNDVELVYLESKNQLADYLTKGLTTKTLRYLMMASNVGPKLETSD